MLRQRIITALLMLAILVPAVFYRDPVAFILVTLVLISAGAWEWARLNQIGETPARWIGVFCAVACYLTWAAGRVDDQFVVMWTTLGAAWVLMSVWLLSKGVPAWNQLHRSIRLSGGLIALWAAWLAVVQARKMGINFLFSVLFLVWAADVFAYFFGRAFGGRLFKRKLAPTISPGKTWEGALGGLLGVVLIALLWCWADRTFAVDSLSLYSRLLSKGGVVFLVAVVFLTAMSVVGDLAESLFKRSAGVKDSSGLLPGHGGVLDRVDALLPVLPLAMMLTSI
jgi:phosphatidate cytidylyltransferase